MRSVPQRNSANTGGPKFVVGGVDHIGRAQTLIARLFPLGNQSRINQVLVDAVVVDFAINSLVGVVKIVDVPRFLPTNLVHRPHGLGLAFVHVGFLHFVS